MATLSDRERMLIELLVSTTVSYREISVGLDMPIGSIGPTRTRILARLRTVLETAGVRDFAVS
jgi:DNA-directed RNA polymerase specialized sigma24 family protein